ncbi:MAG TPA: hypothetical protein VLF66_14200 [Thermoanaerobaculia bacterium]|nr:hypothetical protein [Thermoanaerobaculia bacterium]
MSGAPWVLAALLAAAAAPPAGGTPTAEVEVPGALLAGAVVLHPDRSGRGVVALLVRTGDGPDGECSRDLYLVDPLAPPGSAAAGPELVARDLPAGTRIVPDARPDGSPAGPPHLLAARVGRAEILDPSAPDGLAPTLALPLPRRAERTARGLRLESPAVQAVPGHGSLLCLATEPEAHGRQRLRVLLSCSGQEEPEEVWALLPGAETVTESRYLRLGGVPVLAVLTRTKLGPFVVQDLRVFALAGSRTRAGEPPLLAARTGCPLCRSSELAAADADGDGRDDLVLLCQKGLIDRELRVVVFRNIAAPGEPPRFERRSRAVTVEGEHDAWWYGADLTGDGLPDLLSLRDGRFLELRAGSRGRRPVEGRPAWSVPAAAPEEPGEEGDEHRVEVRAGSDGGGVRVTRGGRRILGVADLDGDGAREVLLYRPVRKRQGEETVWRGGAVSVLPLP